ncbi:HAMP domain-containing sensor histidine kinase [Motiliproteus sp. MSK22-1]|uniref:sensor histidine kinase n=1 Tax=Motiliproteus sp. MSK22-1 TaxID=1897630 RepID=UPI00097598F6|nr:ATP-binding protein [Motiliproteus sp. MSK22-1]OMH38259.1 hypothetical protein BGP75_08400 [Motiliproteus sp. MSK22-1]
MLIIGRNKPQTLRRQLLTFLLLSIALLSILSSVVGAWVGSSQSRSMLVNSSLQIAGNLAERSVLSLITSSEENAEEATSQVLGFSDVIGVAILNEELTPLLIKGILEFNAEKYMSLKNNDGPKLAEEDSKSWRILAPVYFPDIAEGEDEFEMEAGDPKKMGYVIINVSKESLIALSDNLLVYNILIGVVTAATMGALMNIGIGRLTQPIFNLSHRMKQAQESGEHTFARIEGAKEIRQMAESYNGMMKVLEKQEDELIGMNVRLESEVEIRTKELIQARDAALVAARTKSEFLANISHELRTPLQAVMGYIELVKEELEFEAMDQQIEDLEEAMKSSQRLLALIGSILDLAKSESGKMEMNPQETSLIEVMDDLTAIVKPLAAENNNQLVITPPRSNIVFIADREKVMHVLLNLLSNACKFTHDGSIEFTVKKTSETLKLSISDTGIGISQDQHTLIFDEFRQVDGSVKRQYGGTGLGLAISKRFAQMMGGNISVTSSLGKGACFTLSLPLNSSVSLEVENKGSFREITQ